jgi:hypothetical protein
MNKEISMDPERALQTAPLVYLGEASRVAASLKHAQGTNTGERFEFRYAVHSH